MYVLFLSLCIVVAAIVVQRFANEIDEQLNACGTGIFKNGACECVHPYTGAHCEIVNCGYGKLVDSVFAYDTITTPNGPSGCACESQFWGYNCAQCTSEFKDECTGLCDTNYYGPRCDILCMEGTENTELGVHHVDNGGTYNYHVGNYGFCKLDGTVQCRANRAGEHCEIPCKDCKYGQCNLGNGECDCFDGYTGELCELTCPNRCSGLNGVCKDVNGVPTCDCYDGFTGDDCSLECCVKGRGTDLGTVHGTCLEGIGGCNCSTEVSPVELPIELNLDYYGQGWQGAECDCHENITCGGRGLCVEGGCDCAPNFQGTRCELCADDKIGPFCQYDRYQCPNRTLSHGEFVPINSHGDYKCKCNPGFAGDKCESCAATAYPKSGPQMCEYIIPDALCHSGSVNPNYSGTGTMCTCPGHFDNSKDCAVCEEGWYGPNCDIECGTTCTNSGGVCSNAGPGCVCPKGRQSVDGECVTCSGGDCKNGECWNGICQCDPGYYGDLCDITAPEVNGKVCNGFSHVVHEEPVQCMSVTDCTDISHSTPANREVAIQAAEYGRDMFCHRDDTPIALKTVSGCCVDRNADGFCDADMLSSSCSYINEVGMTIEGDVVPNICNQRALEGEVNVFEWCLSQERNCTKNGACADPDLCKDMCDAGLSPSEWISIWEYEHSRTMADVMSEAWKFPVNFSDPFEYREAYTHANISDVCVGETYDRCRDYLIPEDSTVYNLTHKFTNQWEPMPNYQDCTLSKVISMNVNGKEDISISPIYAGVIETLQDNTAVFARYNNGDESYTANHMIDSITVFAKGDVDIIIYNYTSETCSEFVRKVGSDYDACSQIKFHELDYDWSAFCKWRPSVTPSQAFNDTCYQQSKVCDGCDNYQEGCEGLPVNMTSPMPAPCDIGWEGFCTDYLSGAVREGTCAYAKCECEGYGVGGEACDLQCPVPQGVTSELSCGAGEDPPMGRCDKNNGATALGYEQGLCSCFNGGDPTKGCVLSCTGDQDCSKDVDTPFTFVSDNCDYQDNVSYIGGECTVNLRDSMCNFYRGRCECATPFTLYTDSNQTEYANPHGSYRVALMQGYVIDEYLQFTTYDGTPPTDLAGAFDNIDPNFKCFKDLEKTQEVSCDWIRALKHFARGGSHRIGDCHDFAPGTDETTQVPCSGHGFPVAGKCACDYAEEFDVRSSGVGLAFELPGLSETPWRGKDCGFLCPGYDMKSMSSVCSGHGLCASDGRCDCDQGWTGYQCDLACEQTQEILSCSGHGTCNERLYRRGNSDDNITESFDTNCVNEPMYLNRDRVVEYNGVIYHMYESLGLKVDIYSGSNKTTRDAVLDDFFIYGTSFRHPYRYESTVPYMPCNDTLLVKREEAVLPFGIGEVGSVYIPCRVLPGYEVRCGECTCEETSQSGHWTGHDCRTPALGYYSRNGRLKCPGMVDGVPCNGGGTCMWGSYEGEGTLFTADVKCYCGDAGPDATEATAPRTDNNRFIVHAMNGESPLYRKVIDSVDPTNGLCPEGTREEGGVCVPTELMLENYNSDCSCKFGWQGTTCETPRMMCLFSGVETDGSKCLCVDNNNIQNRFVNEKGCCTKGTYWDQKRYKSFSVINDFAEIDDNSLYLREYQHVCRLSPTWKKSGDTFVKTTEFDELDMHNYVVNTREYILEASDCIGVDDVPLYSYVLRHGEDISGVSVQIMDSLDPVQECLQHCGNLNKPGFFLVGTQCQCREVKAFEDGDTSVFSGELTGAGQRYDILYPQGCFKANGKAVINSKTGPETNPNHFLVPTRFLLLKETTSTASTMSGCFDIAVNTNSDAFTYNSGTCVYGTIMNPSECGSSCTPTNGYIVKQGDYKTKYVENFLPNPRPCGLESYLTYPTDMAHTCGCPIWEYEDCAPSSDTLLYSAAVTAKNATKHSCISACTLEDKGTARPVFGESFECWCGDTCGSGTGAYRLSHDMFKISGPNEICSGDWEYIEDEDTCSKAAEYIGNIPTLVYPPAVLDASDQQYVTYGCGLFTDGDRQWLIHGGEDDPSSNAYSQILCQRPQICKCEGFYIQDGLAYSCPAGKYSDTCSHSCIECPVGQFSQEGASACGECEAGSVQDGPTSCFTCLPGTFATKGDDSCTDCAVGYYNSQSGQSSCVACGAGEYSASTVVKTSTNTCKSCPSGRAQDSVGKTSCDACSPGYYADVTGLTSCKTCSSGMYQSQYGKTSCTICQDGKYQNSGGQSSCKNCPAGYENIPRSGSYYKRSCEACPKGYYSGTGWEYCKSCSRGQYADQTGRSSCKSCGTLWRSQYSFPDPIHVTMTTFEYCDQAYPCGYISNVDNQFYGFSGDGNCDDKSDMLGQTAGRGDTWRKCCYYHSNDDYCAEIASRHGDNTNAWQRRDSPWGGWSLCDPITTKGFVE